MIYTDLCIIQCMCVLDTEKNCMMDHHTQLDMSIADAIQIRVDSYKKYV